MITEDKIAEAVHAIAPAASHTALAEILAPQMRVAGIDTPNRAGAFLGQCAVESLGFTQVSEDLTYTTPIRLMAVWPSRFPTVASCLPYVNQPEALANLVYANRLGNGNTASGDGWRFRGAGFIQLSGRYNVTRFAKVLGKSPEATADFMRTPIGACASAVWYWVDRGMNQLADGWQITKIGALINGKNPAEGNDRRLLECNIALGVLRGG